MSDQKTLLLSVLQSQRRHLLKTIDGLDEETMLTQVLPSRWSPAGLIHHLTHDVERFWFRQVLLNEPNAILTPAGEEAWDVPLGMTASQIVDDYQREAAYNDGIVARLELDTQPAWWDDDLFGHGPPQDLGEILLHVITETATHAGHMDIVRELYDGQQHLVLTNEERPKR